MSSLLLRFRRGDEISKAQPSPLPLRQDKSRRTLRVEMVSLSYRTIQKLETGLTQTQEHQAKWKKAYSVSRNRVQPRNRVRESSSASLRM